MTKLSTNDKVRYLNFNFKKPIYIRGIGIKSAPYFQNRDPLEI